MRLKSRRGLTALFCALVIYLTLFFQLGGLPFLGADEPRYARIGEEMLESGDYVTPRLLGQPWLEKPPLLFWLEAASFRLFGVSEASARLPSALIALLTTLLTAFLAHRVLGRRAALLTLLILPTSGLFFAYGRAASTDMPLTGFLTAALIAAALAARDRRLRWAPAVGACLALATLAKGPVALVLFLLVVGLYSLLTWRIPWTPAQTALGGVVFCALASPWFWLVWRENGYNFIATFIVNHHLARFLTSIHHHSQPAWYYAPVLLLGFFPWIFFLGSSLRRAWRFRFRFPGDRPLEPFLWIWALAPVFFFSLGDSKLAGYVLPSLPPLALLAAIEWDRLLSDDVTAFRSMKAELAVLGSFALALAAGLVIGGLVRYGSVWAGLWMAVPVAASALWGRHEFVHRRAGRLFLSLAVGMTLTATLACWRVAPILSRFHSAKEISLTAKPLVSKEEPLILYKYFHHSAQYYTGYQTTPEALPEIEDVFDYLLSHPQKRYYILTQKDGWQRLQNDLDPVLIQQQGDFYLAEIDDP